MILPSRCTVASTEQTDVKVVDDCATVFAVRRWCRKLFDVEHGEILTAKRAQVVRKDVGIDNRMWCERKTPDIYAAIFSRHWCINLTICDGNVLR